MSDQGKDLFPGAPFPRTPPRSPFPLSPSPPPSSPRFLALLAALAASLAACTYTRQLPTLRRAQRWSHRQTATAIVAASRPRGVAEPAKAGSAGAMGSDGDGSLALAEGVEPLEVASNASGVAELLPGASLVEVGAALRRRGYQTFVGWDAPPPAPAAVGFESTAANGPPSGTLYAFKGLVGRVAPLAVHAGLLLSMTGFVLGASSGWVGDAMVPTGGAFVPGDSLRPVGPLSTPPAGAGAVVRVDDFRIRYRDNGEVAQARIGEEGKKARLCCLCPRRRRPQPQPFLSPSP